jgi:hypothetical protein
MTERRRLSARKCFMIGECGGAGVKLHFYIGNDDDAERCKESFYFQKPIVIGGTDSLTGRVKSFTGVVLAVESAAIAAPGERWRITIDSGMA